MAAPDQPFPLPRSEHSEHHADVSGGWLRPAVFGAMDGLVSNIALIAGVSGGGASTSVVLLAGAAGTIAGAVSMAFGEYTSVRTQNEQIGYEIAKERRELANNPQKESEEIARIWESWGVPPNVAQQAAAALSAHPKQALRVHAQAELGVDPDKVPSPWVAGVMSLWCFAVGALIPLFPYIAGFGTLLGSLLCGAAGLFVAGAVVARWTYRSWWISGLRQLVLGAFAAGATYLLGSLLGSTA